MASKILLIDDSKTQLDVMKLRLTKCGYEIETASNGLEGYNKVFSFIPDIVLSDVIMPELDGYQLCRLIKNNKLTKNIPVILLTVLDKKLDEFWGKKAGADLFISKTADFDSIKLNIEKQLETSKLTNKDRENIKKGSLEQGSVKEQVNDILNELLKQSIFLNEFRNLGEFYTHEGLLIEKCFNLFSTFIDYDLAGLFFNIPDASVSKNIVFDTKNNSISQFVLEKIKRDFFNKMNIYNDIDSNMTQYEILENNSASNNTIISPNYFKTIHIIPLVFEEKLLGGLCLCSLDEIDYQDLKLYDSFIKELLALMKMKYLYSKVEFLSVTDGLTGLYNRRYFEYNIEREFFRAKRYKNNLSMAILDIDFFKNINDTYGHQHGDFVLKEISKLIRESFRRTDILCRYGGEEIVIIMPETSLENAVIPSERLKEKIANKDFIYNNTNMKLTVSIGISAMSDEFNNQKEIIESADRALYKAKQTGRNKVVIFNEQLDTIK